MDGDNHGGLMPGEGATQPMWPFDQPPGSLFGETTKALDAVLKDIKDVASRASSLKSWLSVPPEFRKT